MREVAAWVEPQPAHWYKFRTRLVIGLNLLPNTLEGPCAFDG